MAFSTLLMLQAGRPTRLTGVHCFKAATTNCTVEGLFFISDPQLLITAESSSVFLTEKHVSTGLEYITEYSLVRIKERANTFQQEFPFGFQCGY